jgi:hypothetical protein
MFKILAIYAMGICFALQASAQISVPSASQLLDAVRAAAQPSTQSAQTTATTPSSSTQTSSGQAKAAGGGGAGGSKAKPSNSQAQAAAPTNYYSNAPGKGKGRKLTEEERQALERRRGVPCDIWGNCMD